jgi:hypothetical protein
MGWKGCVGREHLEDVEDVGFGEGPLFPVCERKWQLLWRQATELATALWLGSGRGREADFSAAQLTMRL